MFVDLKTYGNAAALHALGASSVAEVRDPKKGTLTGYEISPDIDLTGYAAAVSGQLDVTKADLRVQVDAKAESLRLQLITPGSGQAMEYQEAYAEASKVEAALEADSKATFDPADYPMLAASIGYDIDPTTSKPTKDVAGEARSVLAAYRAYQTAGAAIRKIRLEAKAAIDAAIDAAGAQAAFDAVNWPSFG